MRSVTTWTRLEPRTRDAALRDGLRAAVHDPLWLLGRQWQTGELVGEDAGSLIDASLSVGVDSMARFRPGPDATADEDAVYTDTDPLPPLEALAEREQIRPSTASDSGRNLRLAAEAGSHFLRLLGAKFDGAVDAFPESVTLAPSDRDEDTERFTTVVGGRALDGDALYDAYDFAGRSEFGDAVGGTDSPPLPDDLERDDDVLDDYWDVITAYRSWYRDCYGEPERPDGTWNRNRLEYEFAVSTGSEGEDTVFRADAYEGGRLDWYAFESDPDGSLEPPDADGPASKTVSRRVLPTPTSFDGMPAERWWEFEDDGVDLSAVEAAPEDLSRLLMLEFALVFGNDWFTVPVDLPVRSLARVQSLEVVTTFDERITIEDAVTAGDDPTTAWNMYSMPLDSAGTQRGLFFPPTLGDSLESDAIETVEFARDEMANVGWAVETVVEGGVGQARDRVQEAASGETSEPIATADGADLAYQLSTDVPENWFPLLPRRVSLGDVVLDRGRLLDGDDSVADPLGRLLDGDLSLPEAEVSRTGKTATRTYALARWSDGTTHCWSGRRVGVGSGGTSSGLAFDRLVEPQLGGDEPPVGDPEPFPDAEPVPPTGRLALAGATFETSGGPREHLDEETVTFRNTGSGVVDMSGWRIEDAADHSYTVPDGTTVTPGATMTLHTGVGDDVRGDRYWGRRQAVWNDDGDVVAVYDDSGALVLKERYPPLPPDVSRGLLSVVAIEAEAPGPEYENLDAETVTFENVSDGPLSLAGWRIEDDADHAYEVPAGTELPVGGTITLHTGVGTDSTTDLYWNLGAPVWNNDGDTISVYDDAGTLRLRQSY